MEVSIPSGFALIVSTWGYHVTTFKKAESGSIRFYSNDDLGDEWWFSHYHSEYDVYYSHSGVDLDDTVHVIACGTCLEDVASIALPHGQSVSPCISYGTPTTMMDQLNDLAEGRGDHAEFARKREVLCSFPILYPIFVETGSVEIAQATMLARMEGSDIK